MKKNSITLSIFSAVILAQSAICWVMPIDNPIMVSDFGPRNREDYNTSYAWDFHEGIDFRAAVGTPVRAISNGAVTLIRYNNTQIGSGNYLQYSSNTLSPNGSQHRSHVIRYLHLSSVQGTIWRIVPGNGVNDPNLPYPSDHGIIVFYDINQSIK